jgi:hypothetical protein
MRTVFRPSHARVLQVAAFILAVVISPLLLPAFEVLLEQGAQPMFVLSAAQFDQWAFNANDSSNAFSQLDSQLKLRIEAIDRASKLSDAQKRKIQLAGARDVKRFRDRYEEMKRKYENTSHPQNDITKIHQEIQTLQTEWRSGVLGNTSLFAKVARSVLEPEQSESSDQADAERKKFYFKARVEATIATLENSVAITSAQRADLQKLLLAETRPPKEFGQYDQYVVLLQAAQFPQQKLRAIFDDPQFEALQPLFEQAKRLEPTLHEQGVLPEGYSRQRGAF